MEKLRRFYETLEINPEASIDEIRQAYHDMVNVWHPDKYINNPRLHNKATEKMQEINEAYEKIVSFHHDYGRPNFPSDNTHGNNSEETVDFSSNEFSCQYDYNEKANSEENNKTSPSGKSVNTTNTTNNNVTDIWDVYSIAVGKNNYYYLKIFKKLVKSNPLFNVFNCAAFFGGIYWLLYRKLYKTAFFYVLYVSFFIYLDVFSFYLYSIYTYSSLIISLILFAFIANSIYFNHIKKLCEMNYIESEKKYDLSQLSKDGGVNMWVPYIIGAVLVGLLILGLISIAIPNMGR